MSYYDTSSSFGGGPSRLTPAVKWLIIANVAVFILELMPWIDRWVVSLGVLVPSYAFGRLQVWRFLTYMFLHDFHMPFHLMFNMLALWMFGLELERRWGARRFTAFYLISGVLSGMLSFFKWDVPIIGASGAVLAVLTAYAVYFPHTRLLFFFVLPMSARTAVILTGIISLAMSFSSGGGIAHITHLAGIVVGFVAVRLMPVMDAWLDQRRAMRSELESRRVVDARLANARFFETRIDPILKKISEHGMASLTRAEKALLQKAAHQDGDRLKSQKIVPFDLFKR